MGDLIRRIPWIGYFQILFVNTEELNKKLILHNQNTKERVEKRLNNTEANKRKDFFSHLVKDGATAKNLDFLMANGSPLIMAGSETTSTFMAGVTYY